MTDHPASSAHGFTEGSDEAGGIAEPRCITCGVRQSDPCPAEEPACRFEDPCPWCGEVGDHKPICQAYSRQADKVDDFPPLEKWREIADASADMFDAWMKEQRGIVTERAHWKERATLAEEEIERLRAELAEAKAATAAVVAAERERCAEIAGRDCDWSAFGKREVHQQWDGGPDAVRDYRIGIVAGRAIAAAIRGGDTP